MVDNTLLEINNLVTTFRTPAGLFKAVNNISFQLKAGQTIGIVGESGSGKSVTSLSIMQLIPNPPGKVTDGEIFYHSKNKGRINLLTCGEKTMQQLRGNEIAMIFQEPMTSLNPVLTCGQQVMEALMLHQKLTSKEARQKTLALFEEVQLPTPEAMLTRYPHELSGGQKQRVMIAMAISCNPRVLIADEPTTALDVTVQKTILELLKKLQQRYNMGIIFITHDLGVIAELADTVMVMYKGNLVEQGPVSQIFQKASHPYTKSLLACRPPLDKRLHTLPTVKDFMEVQPDGSITEVHKPLNTAVITPQQRLAQHEALYRGNKILEIKNLCTWYPAKKSLFGKVQSYTKALDDVSFDVYEGETLGLVGESGCGKTTLGRTILKLAKASSGEVLYHQQNILLLSENDFRQHRKNMQIIFQDPYSSLNPRLTIGQAITEPMQVHQLYDNRAQRVEKAMSLLKKVGLEEKHFHRYPHEFSGGQRQRVCIARALALNPKFIICDESVSALDVSVQAQVLNLLNDLKKEFRFTYIFISHDLSVVKFMSDRMVVMQKGKIEEMGDTDAIYNNPQSPYTKRLIDSIPKLTSPIITR